VRDQYDRRLLERESAKASTEEQEKARTADSKANAVVQYQEGMNRLKSGDFWGAEESFRWAMRLDTDKAEYVYRLAQALSRIPRRGHDAEEYFTKAIRMAPKKIEYYLELGSLYERNGLKTKALSLYRNALRYEPEADRIKQALKRVGG
jgi:Tfp pilus assembly protein PilF